MEGVGGGVRGGEREDVRGEPEPVLVRREGVCEEVRDGSVQTRHETERKKRV